MQREEIVKRYFQAWLDQDIEPLGSIFSDDVVYSECYGPEYRGLSQILKWFADWNKSGRVLKWEIKNFIHQGLPLPNGILSAIVTMESAGLTAYRSLNSTTI